MFESLESRKLFAAAPADAPPLAEPAQVAPATGATTAKVSMQDFHFTTKVSMQDFHFVSKVNKASPK